MSANEYVLRLLKGEPAKRMRFKYLALNNMVRSVHPETFLQTAAAIRRGEIKAEYFLGNPHISAFYAMSKKTIFIPKNHGRVQEGQILGACVDAIVHIFHMHLSANDQDAQRKLVNVLYFRMTGLTPTRWHERLQVAAGKVAEEVLRAYQKNPAETPMIDEKVWAGLSFAVALEPSNNDLGFHMKSGILGTAQQLSWDENDTVSE